MTEGIEHNFSLSIILTARCLTNKIALNFYAKIQARLQMESDKKKGISKPEIAVYLAKLPSLLEQLGLCMKSYIF